MFERLRFLFNRIGEKLWVKPLAACMLSIVIVFLVKKVEYFDNIGWFVPAIDTNSIENLLSIVASSMLVIATLAVGSMVSAYSSASSTTTPRSFPLVISDDKSQNALSTFIGTFIYSIIALMALKNDYYNQTGRFVIFVMTLIILAMVIVTFVRWVDSIARLGRLRGVINKVEAAAGAALQQRRLAPTLQGRAAGHLQNRGHAVYGDSIGYVQRVDVAAMQAIAEKSELKITVAALPGTFSTPGRPLAYVTSGSGDLTENNTSQIVRTFLIGKDRKFDEDPRFGLIVLSEIASRALSPAVNDPGTAIEVIGTLIRLFALWNAPIEEGDRQECICDRVAVPELLLKDMFDDAFTAIARDGAGTIEVVVRLQKAFHSLASIGDDRICEVAKSHARMALARAERALDLPEDIEIARKVASVIDVG